MMTEDYPGLKVPDWFFSKYPYFHYAMDGSQPTFSIASRSESKFYGEIKSEEVFLDLQKVIGESHYDWPISVVLLHECGGITLVFISKDKIQAREPIAWKEVESVEHSYCNGCSEPPNFRAH